MDLLNSRVTHVVYGEGIVISTDGIYFDVRFDSGVVRSFDYPYAFNDKMILADEVLQEEASGEAHGLLLKNKLDRMNEISKRAALINVHIESKGKLAPKTLSEILAITGVKDQHKFARKVLNRFGVGSLLNKDNLEKNPVLFSKLKTLTEKESDDDVFRLFLSEITDDSQGFTKDLIITSEKKKVAFYDAIMKYKDEISPNSIILRGLI